jgi:hypothetical protein
VVAAPQAQAAPPARAPLPALLAVQMLTELPSPACENADSRPIVVVGVQAGWRPGVTPGGPLL